MSAVANKARCGCDSQFLSFWDDEPTFRYEIVWCRRCNATWAFDYDPIAGNVEVPVHRPMLLMPLDEGRKAERKFKALVKRYGNP